MKRQPRPDLSAYNRARSAPFEDRYVPEPNSGCWLWLGAVVGRMGYGHMKVEGRAILAHRRSWLLRHGSIPDGLKVLHRCDVPCCVNPDHLFLGTVAANNADRDAKGRHRALRGEDHPAAKLTEAQVQRIRTDRRENTPIADSYGVTPAMIGHIKHKRAWRHLR